MHFTLYLRLDTSERPLFGWHTRRDEIQDRAARTFGGFSSSVVQGGWVDPQGTLIKEGILRLEIETTKGALAVTQFADWAGRLLEQQVVMIVGQLTQTIYYKVNPVV